MTILYVATNANRLKAIEVNSDTGEFVRTVQDIDPIVRSRKHQTPLTPGDIENNNDHHNSPPSRIDTNNDKEKSFLFEWLTSHLNFGMPTTEWIERHPTFDSLLYVFTSFGSKRSAVVTTYRILGIGNNNGNNEDDSEKNKHIRGQLKKLGSVETQGLHVAHVAFSPDYSTLSIKAKPPSTLCVGHYLDGSLSFFDCSQDCALGEPQKIVVLPEIRPETRRKTLPNPLPSIHHVTYNPRGRIPSSCNDSDDEGDSCNYLLVSETSKQGRVWTYNVDSIGLPISSQPASFLKVTFITPPSGWFARLVTGSWVAGLADYRIRRCAVHPNGLYAYLLLEFNCVIQVYEIQPETGRISGDCLQEIPTIDPNKVIGLAVHGSAELHATDTEIFVLNRGLNPFPTGSWAESDVRVFSIENNGAKLVPKTTIACAGRACHFLALPRDQSYPTQLFVGSDMGRQFENVEEQTSASIETFVRSNAEEAGGTFERVGIANVGMDRITCIAALS
ncbi:unnamed protein product [Pseudo-nitzschia multistriata]|uniref:Uncharacterized protein n=1 Tax=Pseudo-nitzschia multistriata TaxID=183589 RepID=A0A448YV28_9STRA|nr:unnamed protein product [Pseudo-nitzschia multistriata]